MITFGKAMMTFVRVLWISPIILLKGTKITLESLMDQMEEPNYPCALESDIW